MASTGDAATWRLGRRPALDGLRGVAVLLVVADHFAVLSPPTGSVGVTVFFALSGFLITRVILEARQDGSWSFRSFVGNRLARLFPALVVMLTVTSTVAVASGYRPATVGVNALRAGLYVQNFFMDQTLNWWMFRHTWSLAVEEQFYLLWPLALPWLLRRRTPARWIAAAIIGSLACRAGIFATGAHELAQASLVGNAFALLLGCALAMVVPHVKAPGWVLPVGAVGLVATLAVGPVLPAPFLLAPVPGALASTLLVWGSLRGNRLLEVGVLRFSGRISYALYLWHLPLLWLLAKPVALPLSFLVAIASTLWLEEPVRRWWHQCRMWGTRPEVMSGRGLASLDRAWLTAAELPTSEDART